jgi:hypothetical protein
VRAFYVTFDQHEPRLVAAKSRGSALYGEYLSARECWDFSFREFLGRVRVTVARLAPPPPRDPAMTDQMRELARHALGLPNRDWRSYRNRFVTAATGPDGLLWEAMVAAELADNRVAETLPFGGADIYWLTKKGALSALESGESLCPEDFPERAA